MASDKLDYKMFYLINLITFILLLTCTTRICFAEQEITKNKHVQSVTTHLTQKELADLPPSVRKEIERVERLAKNSVWITRITDEYSGIQLLGPPLDTDNISLSDVTAYWTLQSCGIGGDTRIKIQFYRKLNGIYVGGWCQGAGLLEFKTLARAHLLAFPAEGQSANTKMLIKSIRDVFNRYYSIDIEKLTDEESTEVQYFDSSQGINGKGYTTYAALQVKNFIYLAVISSKDKRIKPNQFIKVSKQNASLLAPSGNPMSPRARIIMNSKDNASESNSEKYNKYLDWDWWSQVLISFIVFVAFIFFALKIKEYSNARK